MSGGGAVGDARVVKVVRPARKRCEPSEGEKRIPMSALHDLCTIAVIPVFLLNSVSVSGHFTDIICTTMFVSSRGYR